MKHALAALLCTLAIAAARGEEVDTPSPATAASAPAPALAAPAGRTGYAFDNPDILIRQRLFGLAHGLSLLAAACLDQPQHATAIENAYAAWHAGQAGTIEILVHDLAAWYFGPRAGEAQWPDLAHALGLAESIQPALGQVALDDACASLPEAIARPRYQLDKLLAEANAATAPAADRAPR